VGHHPRRSWSGSCGFDIQNAAEFPPVIYGGLGTAVGGLVEASANAGMAVGILLFGQTAGSGYGKFDRYRRRQLTPWRRASLLGRLFSKCHGFKGLRASRRSLRGGNRTFFTCIRSGCGRSRKRFATGSGNRSFIPSIH